MNRIVLIALAVAALAITGCTEKPKAQPASAAQGAGESGTMQPSPAHGGASQSGQAVNPHAAVKPMEMNAGADHRGKVVSTMNASGYTYMEIEENGKKFWVAATQVEVKPGDEVVFPDSPPVENFRSKTLNRTFDKIILAPAVQVNGRPGQMGAHPQTGDAGTK
ncbi:MAG TPA: hypothetical protein VMT71_04915 [Syntrophorhabdales bacterium]|nr:hypothetical protein [Syntrophorhabdales bacterium]